MRSSGLDFNKKEVININNGKKLGYVQDVNAELKSGNITSILVPGSYKFINIFSDSSLIEIPWEKITCIGEDVILVDI